MTENIFIRIGYMMLCNNSYVQKKDQYHPVWGQLDNYAVGREKRRQLLLMLCQQEAERLEVWAQPVGSK